MNFRLTFFLTLLPYCLFAQVVTSLPPQPTINDSVIVIFDATQGDGGLAGYTGDVYAHTGVITDKSTHSTDWRYVVADWHVNVPKAKLTPLGNDRWQLTIGEIRRYYGVPASEKVLKLAFVFRSADRSRTGRDVNGADIFLPLFEPGLTLLVAEPVISIPFGLPERSPLFIGPGDTLRLAVTAAAVGTQLATISVLNNGTELAQTQNDTLALALAASQLQVGRNDFIAIARDTAGATDSSRFVVMRNPAPRNLPPPTGIVDGINYINNTTVTLSLFAPRKQFVYVIGDFNDWIVDTTHYMNRYEAGADSVRFWLTLENLDPDTEYAFQYLVDGQIRIADPYTEKVLDPWNDRFIDSATYPNLKPYPQGKTTEIAATFWINEPDYRWDTETVIVRPPPENLVIYELLIRDFIAAHNYQTLIDTLGYLKRLGINAIELMPVNEFDGNISWGYNPSFYFAPDKYYGPKNELKRFIDACHQNDILVILDMVLNHSTGQSPLVRLYAKGNYGPPAADNPWFNEQSPNPVFSFFEDMNHESPATQVFVDRVNDFWLSEYRIDGFRFDFTKGFTNRPGDGFAYDASRIAILKRMADRIRAKHPDAYIILEHFADNREEIELADYGMLLWGNMNTPYSQSAMGWLEDAQRSSDLSWGYYTTRGWHKPHLVTYMESHDEPWLMFKNLQFGRKSGDYDVKALPTALDRIKLVATFFLTLPGPKMLWQFGELGYDQELPTVGRTDPKPILWHYFRDADRNRLYRFYAALVKLRREVEAFRSPDAFVQMRVGQGQYDRWIKIAHASMNAVIVGNFHVVPQTVSLSFLHPGTWYDYFSGDSLVLSSSLNVALPMAPGEFHIYTSKPLPPPDPDLITAVDEPVGMTPREFELSPNYPNPFNPSTQFRLALPRAGAVELVIYNPLGNPVRRLIREHLPAGVHHIVWDGRDDRGRELPSGLYLARLQAAAFTQTIKLTKIK